MAKSRATNAELELRVSTVYNLLLTGTERESIVRYAAKTWGVEARTVDTYLQRAKTLIAAHAATDRTQQLGLARARLNMLFAKAYACNNWYSALSVQKEINALEALYAPPAPRTLNLTSEAAPLLAQLLKAFESRGMTAADVFNAMLATFAEVDQEAGDHAAA